MIKLWPLKPFHFISALMICGVTLLCSLGCWQLSRAAQKQALLSQASEARTQQPLSVHALLTEANPSTLRYYPIKLSGTFFNDQTILLDNKVNNGEVGYHVLVPFLLNEHTLILVNRGWIPQGRSRAILPSISPIKGETTIEGYLDFAYRNPLIKSAIESNIIQWPLRMQQLDMGLLKDTLGKNIYPMLVTLNNESSFAFSSPKAPVVWMSPERHQGYAVQWFSLAATLFGFYLFTQFRQRAKHEHANNCKNC
ncbi:MAG: hypothetical protein BGO43_06245 [Gammaproteobacteria bacterium 39-13]|nr:SURF1 family protein [Gammaproteobacteria bacterium]OJV90448.1 MAG: hypothetical protein BGO43_06245 [Gammaproteobacteria bacterium 39-13]